MILQRSRHPAAECWTDGGAWQLYR